MTKLTKDANQKVSLQAQAMGLNVDQIPHKIMRSIIFEVVKESPYTYFWLLDNIQRANTLYALINNDFDSHMQDPNYKSSSRTVLALLETCIILYQELDSLDYYSTVIQSNAYVKLYNSIVKDNHY